MDTIAQIAKDKNSDDNNPMADWQGCIPEPGVDTY